MPRPVQAVTRYYYFLTEQQSSKTVQNGQNLLYLLGPVLRYKNEREGSISIIIANMVVPKFMLDSSRQKLKMMV